MSNAIEKNKQRLKTDDKTPKTAASTAPKKTARLHVENDLRAGVCYLPGTSTVVRATKDQCTANHWEWKDEPKK